MQDMQDVLEGLRRTPGVLSELLKEIPESRLDLRRGEGFWTISEHVSHLAQVQPMLLERFRKFMTEDHPEFAPYVPDKNKSAAAPDMKVAAALEQFSQYRDKELALLEGADAAVWQKTGTHPEYEHYPFKFVVRHALMHDYWHMYRIEQLWLVKDAYLTKGD